MGICYIGIIFSYSLLTTGKFKGFGCRVKG